MRKIEIRLMGGIGNQLFIAAYATLAARLLSNTKVTLATSELSRQKHSSRLTNLALNQFFGSLADNFHLSSKPYFLTKFGDLAQASFLREHIENIAEVGFSGWPEVRADGARVIRGYFQSQLYLEELRRLGAPLSLVPKNQGADFIRATSSKLMDRVAVVHIRRGDYLKLRNTVGALGWRYYSEAIELCIDRGAKNIILLSDDSEVLQHASNYLPKAEYADLGKLGKFSDEEALSLASKSPYFVMSNSTFSYWAAMTGAKSLIVRPKEWFRALQQPQHLFLESNTQHVLLDPNWDN